MSATKQKLTNDEKTFAADTERAAKTIKVKLIDLVRSKAALDSFMAFPLMPGGDKLDLTVQVLTVINPHTEAYFTGIKAFAAEQGASTDLNGYSLKDFPSEEQAARFFAQVVELNNKEIELKNLKTVTYSQIKKHTSEIGIDLDKIPIGGEFTQLTWLVDLTA